MNFYLLLETKKSPEVVCCTGVHRYGFGNAPGFGLNENFGRGRLLGGGESEKIVAENFSNSATEENFTEDDLSTFGTSLGRSLGSGPNRLIVDWCREKSPFELTETDLALLLLVFRFIGEERIGGVFA